MLEILKYTLPSLIVLATAYFLLKMFLDNQQQIATQKLLLESAKTGLPLKLQAYERFTILCDRCDIGPLLLRMRTPEMNASDLKMAMMIAVNQEFEHNSSQKMYISETLWQILSLAKSETLDMIQNTPAENDSVEAFIRGLFERLGSMGGVSPLQRGISAIRAEVRSII